MVASNWKYSLRFSFWKTQYSQRFRYTCKRHLWYIKAVLGQLFLQPSLNKPDYVKAYIKTTFLKQSSTRVSAFTALWKRCKIQ